MNKLIKAALIPLAIAVVGSGAMLVINMSKEEPAQIEQSAVTFEGEAVMSGEIIEVEETKPTDTNQASGELKSILGEIPNYIFDYLELSDDIRKEWKYGSKASDFGGHNQFVQQFSKRLETIIRTEKLKLLDEVIHQSTINLKSAKAVAGWADLRKKQLEAEL